jgi:cytochrome P450
MKHSSRIEPTASSTLRKIPPGPRGHWLLGSIPDFLNDSLGYLRRMAQDYGDVVRYRVAHMIWYQVNQPAGIARILQENNRNYGKGTLTLGILRPVAGNGLFLSEGEFWLRQRRLMQPSFHSRHVAAFGAMMVDATRGMLGRWEAHAAGGRPLDIMQEMSGLTLEIASRALFSTPASGDAGVGQAVATLAEDIGYRFAVPFYPPPRVPTPRNRRQRTALRALDAAVYGIIAARRRGETSGDDLLGLLMSVRDEDTGACMSDQQLRDEVITLFVAGHETTAVALTWVWHLLAGHPDAAERVRAELAAVLGDRAPVAADLSKLPYARMVIDETMRLYPPAWITNRQAIADDQVCGYHIPAGAIVLISPYVMHHHPAYWERADAFEPERFAPERSAGRPPYAYFPFGGGPRQCIGKGLALMEAQLILAMVAQRFRLRHAPGHPVEPQALLTLRPRGGLRMFVEPV